MRGAGARRFLAEFIGTSVLVAAVVGSGVMASRLTSDVALMLLVNAVATVAALGVLCVILAPISGAHLNPAVTAVAVARKELPVARGINYVLAQVTGAVVGVALANVMFGLPALDPSTRGRTGSQLWLGEVVATAGLLLVIGALTRTGRANLGPLAVAAWIGSAYFFTASTSFANPAVTIGRSLTDTFAGIAPASAVVFIGFQLLGAAIGAVLVSLLFPGRVASAEAIG